MVLYVSEYLFFYTVGDNKNILGFMEGKISKIISSHERIFGTVVSF